MSYRKERGSRIARGGDILRDGAVFSVPSESHQNERYLVNLSKSDRPLCTCADFVKTRQFCAHIWAARELLESESVDVEEVIEPPRTYARDWSKYNRAEVIAAELAFELVTSLALELPELPKSRGRDRIPAPLMFSLTAARIYGDETNRSAIALCARVVGKARWEAERFHFNAFSNYLRRDDTTDHLQWAIAQTASVFRDIEDTFIIDSTGIGVTSRGRYREKKYGRGGYTYKRAEWRKLHVAMGRRSKVLTAAIVSSEEGKGSSDSPHLPDLIKRTASIGFTIGRVLADKAYLSESNLEAILQLGGEPFIPFKSNSNPRKAISKQIYHQVMANFDRFQETYNQRPLVECAFSMMKRRFSESVRARDFVAQTNETLFLVLCHNLDVLVHSAVEFDVDLTPILSHRSSVA